MTLKNASLLGLSRNDIDDSFLGMAVRPDLPECPTRLAACGHAVLIIYIYVRLPDRGCVLFRVPPSAAVVGIVALERRTGEQYCGK